MLQSLGEAKVKKSKRSATSKFKVDTKFELPTEAQIFMVLGKPYSVYESTKGDTLRYKFTRGGIPNGSRRGPTIIEMRFIVAKEARKVKRGSVFIRGLKLNIDFTSD